MKDIKFGIMNVETGETQEGYIENGEMKYKPQSWFQRLFNKPPQKTEYIGTTTMSFSWIWSNKETHFQVAVYRDFNPFTNKTHAIYAVADGRKFNFNVDAYLNSGKLITN